MLPRLNEHLELYSDAILQGYDVVIVSHSAGSFYANAALRALPEYTPAALQPTIHERHVKNPLYPKAADMITSVQIAAPYALPLLVAPGCGQGKDSIEVKVMYLDHPLGIH